MPVGMEAGLGPGDFVFDGDPVIPQKKGHTHPHAIFSPRLLLPNGWMDENATWYGSRPWPIHIVLDGVPALRERGTTATPLFSAHVYCGHDRPSQLLLSSCTNRRPKTVRPMLSDR